jgi:hypothetical protein
MSIKQSLKSIIPSSAWNLLRKSYSGFTHLPDLPSAYLHPWRRESMKKLALLKDIHAGKRAFIIGNGPSLKQTDLSRLRNEYTFGLNRIYLLFPELGFQTTYFVTVNDLVIEQCRDDILSLPIPKFLSWRTHGLFPKGKVPATFLYTTYDNPAFARDVRHRVWESATVTYVALQLAFHMGFQQVVLIGVDHNSFVPGKANTTIVSQGDDPNHFNPAYFGKGFRWQLPDFETSEIGYRLARAAYQKAGRQILDATIGGKLTVFPKVEYSSLF